MTACLYVTVEKICKAGELPTLEPGFASCARPARMMASLVPPSGLPRMGSTLRLQGCRRDSKQVLHRRTLQYP